MTFDPTKPVRTRDGRAVRLLCTDRQLTYDGVLFPYVALIQRPERDDLLAQYTADGLINHGGTNPSDLVNYVEEDVEYCCFDADTIWDGFETLQQAITDSGNSNWDHQGVVKRTTLDGELISLELVHKFQCNALAIS